MDKASMWRVRRHAHAAMEVSHDACELESGQILKQFKGNVHFSK